MDKDDIRNEHLTDFSYFMYEYCKKNNIEIIEDEEGYESYLMEIKYNTGHIITVKCNVHENECFDKDEDCDEEMFCVDYYFNDDDQDLAYDFNALETKLDKQNRINLIEEVLGNDCIDLTKV